MYVDLSLLASAVIAFLAGIAAATDLGKSSFKEIALTVSAGVAFTVALYSLMRAVLLMTSRFGPCLYVAPWRMSWCYVDLLTMSGISGISGALGVYLLGLALWGGKRGSRAVGK